MGMESTAGDLPIYTFELNLTHKHDLNYMLLAIAMMMSMPIHVEEEMGRSPFLHQSRMAFAGIR